MSGRWTNRACTADDWLDRTWLENTYPGVACDIPSHNYTFTFDPNPNWSHFFAYGPEIQAYFEGFAERHGSKKYMKLNTKVIECRWCENEGIWEMYGCNGEPT